MSMVSNLVDRHIYDSCVSLGLCSRSHYSFSRLLSRTPSYFSTICLTGKSISADSLFRLTQRLSQVPAAPVQFTDFVRRVALERAGLGD